MCGGGLGQRLEVVATLEHGDDAALGVPVSDRQQFLRQPDEVRGFDVEPRQRIAAVGIEARRDDQELGREEVERRQDAIGPGGAELDTSAAGGKRHVDHVSRYPALARRTGAGIERRLVGRGIEQSRIGLDDGLRALAVMDVKIDDRHAFQAIDRLGMERADRDTVEKAETAGNGRQGVVSRRAHGGEDGLRCFAHHRIDACDHGADGVACRVSTAGAHDCIGIDLDQFAGRRPDGQDRLNILQRVHARELLEGGGRGHDGDQVRNRRIVEARQHGTQPVGALGMVFAGVMGQE